MSGSSQEPEPPTRIEVEFRNLLHSTWTHPVACQNECDPPESCSCQREIVDVKALEAWWRRQASESTNQTKLHRFLEEMPTAAHRVFPLNLKRLFTGDHSCLHVLSLLLKQGRDYLIDRFYESDMKDMHLDIVRTDSDQSLRENLVGVARRDEIEQIVNDFHRERWAYCPLKLTLHMDRNLHGTRVIPPFCHKIKLGDKGGTASIYWVAVQTNLISDDALRLTLQDSIYTDDDHGECYQMVLKSYCGNKKRDFELEKEAFSGLQYNEQVPIVRYLGCYIHDYGEGQDMGKTYNLLLEFGERDLYQSWADETNVPPVRAQEILRFWKSLFGVADAIRHVHHLEVPRARNVPLKFHGWHADIKPDNILSIRGRLKLADFGFSRFAPVAERTDGSVPTELIRGFTDTYGAPEVSRMKRPDGTLSGVSQSIDTWSFGCVLSVAATWVVLGFQGVRQYEQLRQLSPSNNRSQEPQDRFHDGYQVLSEIRKWHDYLRGHLRPSDTVTDTVLDLIEHKLLQTDPSSRPDLDELCDRLSKLSSRAAREIRDLKKPSRDTDPVVLKALLKIEEEAQSQRSTERKTTPLLQQSMVVTGVDPINPRQRASMQIQKERIIKSKPLGQTAYRKEILEGELKTSSIIKEDDEPSIGGTHNGATTNSPVDGTPPLKQIRFTDRPAKPRNPEFQGLGEPGPSGDTSATSHPQVPALAPIATTPTPSPRQNIPSGQPCSLNFVAFETNSQHTFSDDAQNRPDSRRPRLTVVTPESSPSRRYPPTSLQPRVDPPSSTKNTRPSVPTPRPLPPVTNGVEDPHFSSTSPPQTPIATVTGDPWRPESSPSTKETPNPMNYVDSTSRSAYPSPADSHLAEKHVYEPDEVPSTSIQTVLNPGPLITLSEPAEPVPPPTKMDAIQLSANSIEKYTVKDPHDHSSTVGDSQPLLLPSSVYDLPFDICRKRMELDQDVSKGFAKLKGKFGRETRAPDPSLVETFREPRELVLVIDNGCTMAEHWPIATFVAETLAKNAAGLDKSGIDVRFTVDGHRHDKDGLKGDAGRTSLKKALKSAWPEHPPNDNALTDMASIFTNIFKEWKCNGKRATTLLVLTDAVWSKTEAAALHQTILSIARQDELHAGSRHFSIQFIRFGDEELEKKRLQWLDDGLCTENNLRDIIDHCSWRATVDKIFRGSIELWHDQKNSDEPPVLYDYRQLGELFQGFNEGSAALLSPMQSGLQRSLSQSSSRSSTSISRWRDSAPPPASVPVVHVEGGRRHFRMFSH